MKIGLVIFRSDPNRGGAERYTADLAAALVERGEEAVVLSSSLEGYVGPAKTVHLAATGATRVGRYVSFLDALDGHLEEHPYDIVHAMLPVRRCDVYHPHAGVAADYLAGGDVKHEGTLGRGLARAGNFLNAKRRRFAAVERELLNAERGPVVVCLSEYVKETVRKHYAIGEERLATLFNAVDLKRFDPAAGTGAGAEVRRRFGIGDGQVMGLMIAQDFERKGLGPAIEALARLGEERMRLVVVGRPDAGRWKKMAVGLGVGERVVFAGPTSDVYSFYAAADFFVLPTRHDPCSLVVLEALAMGVPVISTRQNGACEIMADGKEGFVLEGAEDVDWVGDSGMREMMHAEKRAAMREGALGLREKISYETHLDRLMEIYRRCARSRQG